MTAVAWPELPQKGGIHSCMGMLQRLHKPGMYRLYGHTIVPASSLKQLAKGGKVAGPESQDPV